MIHPDEAVAMGFTIDDKVYPNCAYKGSRFSPKAWIQVYSPLESRLIRALDAAATRSSLVSEPDDFDHERYIDADHSDSYRDGLRDGYFAVISSIRAAVQ